MSDLSAEETEEESADRRSGAPSWPLGTHGEGPAGWDRRAWWYGRRGLDGYEGGDSAGGRSDGEMRGAGDLSAAC